MHPENQIFFQAEETGSFHANVLACLSTEAAGARLPGGAAQTTHDDLPPAQAAVSLGIASLITESSLDQKDLDIMWCSVGGRNAICILHKAAARLHILPCKASAESKEIDGSTGAAFSTSKPDASSYWDTSSWFGGFFGASDPPGESLDLSSNSPPVDLSTADATDCDANTHVANCMAKIQALHSPFVEFGAPLALTAAAFHGAPPSASVARVFPARATAQRWGALCLLAVTQHGVEKAGLLYSLPSATHPRGVLLGHLPFPASTVTSVHLAEACALCVVQTGDAEDTTVGMVTPLKADGTLCSGWADEPSLQGCKGLLGLRLPGGADVTLASFHSSAHILCLNTAGAAMSAPLQRLWEAAAPCPVLQLMPGVAQTEQTPKHTAAGSTAVSVTGRVRNPLQRRPLEALRKSGASPDGDDGTHMCNGHVWVQCTDRVLWLDAARGLWVRVPGFSAQQRVISMGGSHALVETFLDMGTHGASDEGSDDDPLSELQVLPLPIPAAVCRTGISAADGVSCAAFGVTSPSSEVFLVPGAVALLPPAQLDADAGGLQPACLPLPHEYWGQVHPLRSLVVSAGSCSNAATEGQWRLLVLRGDHGSLVSAFCWSDTECTLLPWQRILAAPGRQLLQAQLVSDREIHVLSKSKDALGRSHAHVSVFQAVLMFAADSSPHGFPSAVPEAVELNLLESWQVDVSGSSGVDLTQIACVNHAPASVDLCAALFISHGHKHQLLRLESDLHPGVQVACDKPMDGVHRITGVLNNQDNAQSDSERFIALRVCPESPVALVCGGEAHGALLCRLRTLQAEEAPQTENESPTHSIAEQRLCVSALQLTAHAQREVLHTPLLHSLLPRGGYLHMFQGGSSPFDCQVTLSNGAFMNTSHALLVALACVPEFHPCVAVAAACLQSSQQLSVVPVVAQQLELALVHAYLLQSIHPGCVQCIIACLPLLRLEASLATVVITARKGEVSELKQWSSMAGHPLLLWATAVQCLMAGVANVALHTERLKQQLHQWVQESGHEAPTAQQHAHAAAELQHSVEPIAAGATLAAYAATQCLMLVQEMYLMQASPHGAEVPNDGDAVDSSGAPLHVMPWLQSPSEDDAAVLDKASDLAQAMLMQLGGGAGGAGHATDVDGAFWVMQLVVACTTRTGVEIQRLMRLLEPVLPRAARVALGSTGSLDEVPAGKLKGFPVRVQRLMLFVSSLQGLQEQVQSFTARMLKSRDSVAQG